MQVEGVYVWVRVWKGSQGAILGFTVIGHGQWCVPTPTPFPHLLPIPRLPLALTEVVTSPIRLPSSGGDPLVSCGAQVFYYTAMCPSVGVKVKRRRVRGVGAVGACG